MFGIKMRARATVLNQKFNHESQIKNKVIQPIDKNNFIQREIFSKSKAYFVK